MTRIKKDNLTDLVSELDKPQENKPVGPKQKPQAKPKPKPEPSEYQVLTPEGEVVNLNESPSFSKIIKTEKGTNIEKILVAIKPSGKKYILVITKAK